MPCFVFELRYLPGLNAIIWLAAGKELEFAKMRSLISSEDNRHGGNQDPRDENGVSVESDPFKAYS